MLSLVSDDYTILNPCICTQARILYETKKAILVTAPYVITASKRFPSVIARSAEGATKQSQDNNIKLWIPKSQIYGIRLRKGVFEIYVKESTIG